MTDRSMIRAMVRGAYDLQRLRIEMGNRIVASFRVKLGIEPGKKEDDVSEAETKSVLADLRQRYRRITDGVIELPRIKGFKGDEIISSYTELCLIHHYVRVEQAETEQFKTIGLELEHLPIWTKFLKDVRGIGPAMAGVIVSEIDIHKARHPSSLWAYAGLDVASMWHLQGTEVVTTNFAKAKPTLDLPVTVARIEGEEGLCEIVGAKLYGEPWPVRDAPKCVPDQTKVGDGRLERAVDIERDGFVFRATYRLFHTGGRSRRKEHLVERKYTDKDGKPATRVGITFNPFLKTKLLGVLASSFLRVGDSPYRTIYDEYKNRMENHATWGIANEGAVDADKHKVTSKGRRHKMSMRYMIKMFLIDLYVDWRKLEGLPVSKPYAEDKLGRVHAA